MGSPRQAVRRLEARRRVHLDDGRSFVRKTRTRAKYDLAVYALVDSLVLHSGYSSIRLENFLFTKQAFQDVKASLKPGGVFAMYNYFRFGWVVGRLNEMVKDVFGVEPVVISLPYQRNDHARTTTRRITSRSSSSATTRPSGRGDPRASSKTNKNFWVNFTPGGERVHQRLPRAQAGRQPMVAADDARCRRHASPPTRQDVRRSEGRVDGDRQSADRQLAAALPARQGDPVGTQRPGHGRRRRPVGR